MKLLVRRTSVMGPQNAATAAATYTGNTRPD